MNPWKAWLPVTSDSLRCTKGEKYFTVFTLLSYTNYLIKNIGVHWLGGLCGRPSSEKPGFESIWKIDKKNLWRSCFAQIWKMILNSWNDRRERNGFRRSEWPITQLARKSQRGSVWGGLREVRVCDGLGEVQTCDGLCGVRVGVRWTERRMCGGGGIARSACADASSFWSWPSSKHDDITTRKDRLPKHKKNMLASSQSWFFWSRAFSHQAWLEPNHSNRCLHLGSANSGKACLSFSKSFLLRNRNLKFARIAKKTWPSVSTILRSLGLALLACNNPGLLTVRSLIMGRASSPSLGLFHFYELVPYQFHDKDESSE